jgi:hypothetical protein
MEIAELAEYALTFYETTQRPGEEETIWVLKDRHPTWIYEMNQKAHEGMLPDDYKYEYITDTLNALEEGRDPEEGAFEIEADVYNHQLLKWLQSHGERAGFVDEAVKEMGHSEQMGLMGDIMMGQAAEKQQVWRSVVESLNERLEEIESEIPEEFRSRSGKIEKGGKIRRWKPKKK